MLRLKDGKALDDLLRGGQLRVHSDTASRGKPAARVVSPAGGALTKQKHEPSPDKQTIEDLMAFQLLTSGLPPARRQHHYMDGRSFKADFAWPEQRIALEVDGHVHRIKGTFSKSFERNYLILMAGWTVLHVGGHEVRSGTAIEWITNLIGARKIRP